MVRRKKSKQNKRVSLNLQPWQFNPTSLREYDIKDLKKLYTAKRDIAQKRIKHLKASEFKENLPIYEIDLNKGIPTLKEMKSIAKGDPEFEKNILTYNLSRLSKWLENEYTKISVLKEVKAKTLTTLHLHGYTWVTSENYMEFVGFEEYLRQVGLDKIYDSEQIVNITSTGKGDFNTEKLKSLFEEYMAKGRRLPEQYFMRR